MELLYAEDLVIICETEKLLNEVILSFERATQAWGLTLSVKKTKTLIANSDEESVSEPSVIRGEQLKRVKEFVYLGSTLTKKVGSVTEIERRINLGYYKFNDLKKRIWNQFAISLKTKVQIYRATILSTVLYGAESWTDKEYSRLNAFNTKLPRVLTRKQQDEISNDRLYKLTGMEPLEDTIRKYRLRWAGHVRRMDHTRLPKKILFGTVAEGKKSAGKSKKNWVDCLEEDCARANIPYGSWTEKAKNRTTWQKSISSLASVKGKLDLYYYLLLLLTLKINRKTKRENGVYISDNFDKIFFEKQASFMKQFMNWFGISLKKKQE
jgi:hypothetical protein